MATLIVFHFFNMIVVGLSYDCATVSNEIRLNTSFFPLPSCMVCLFFVTLQQNYTYMKRMFVFAAAAVCALALCAQDRSNEITVAAGPWSSLNFTMRFFGNDIIALTQAQGKAEIRDVQCSGNYTFNYHKQLKPIFSIGVKATYEQNVCDVYSTDTRPSVVAVMGPPPTFLGHSNIKLVTAMLSMQFTYVNKPLVKVYSGIDIGAGLGIWTRSDVWSTPIPAEAQAADPELKKVADFRDKYDNGTDFYPVPAFDITPVGVKVGTRIYGLAEVNIGVDALVKLGVGVRFD